MRYKAEIEIVQRLAEDHPERVDELVKTGILEKIGQQIIKRIEIKELPVSKYAQPGSKIFQAEFTMMTKDETDTVLTLLKGMERNEVAQRIQEILLGVNRN